MRSIAKILLLNIVTSLVGILLLSPFLLSYAKDNSPLKLTITDEIAYSDNLWHYSNDKIEEYKSGNASHKFIDVESIDDFYNRLRLSLEKEFELIEDYPTTANIFASGTFHFQNTARNYQRYGISLKQRVGSYKTLRVGYSYLPPYYLRTLFDEDYSGNDRYRKAKYDKHSVFIRYWARIVKTLSGWLQYTFNNADYNGDFNERDNKEYEFSSRLRYEVCPKLAVYLGGGYAWTNAHGRDSDTSLDPDISEDNYHTITRVNAKITERMMIIASYRFDWVDFTTSNSVVDDPYHSGRKDRKQTASIRLRYDITDNIQWSVGYKYIIKDAELSSGVGTGVAAEDQALLGYIDNVVFTTARIAF